MAAAPCLHAHVPSEGETLAGPGRYCGAGRGGAIRSEEKRTKADRGEQGKQGGAEASREEHGQRNSGRQG